MRHFPAFLYAAQQARRRTLPIRSRKSLKFCVGFRCSSTRKAKPILGTEDKLGANAGTLIAAPLPAEYEAKGAGVEQAIETAIDEAK